MQAIFVDALLKHGGLSADQDGSLLALQESLFDIGETRDTSNLQELMDAFWDQPQDLLQEIFISLNFQKFADDLESVHVELLGRAGFQLS